MAFSSSLARSFSAMGSVSRTGMAFSMALTTCSCHETEHKNISTIYLAALLFKGDPSKKEQCW